MILIEPFTQVVQQDGQMEGGFVADFPVGGSHRSRVMFEGFHGFDGSQCVFVHGVTVVLVELQQTARVGHVGDDVLQHSGVVHVSQQAAQIPSGSHDFAEGACTLVGQSLANAGHPDFDGFRHFGRDGRAVQAGGVVQLENRFQAAADRITIPATHGHALRAHLEHAVEPVRHDGLQHAGCQGAG